MREIRPWYRPHIQWSALLWALLGIVGLRWAWVFAAGDWGVLFVCGFIPACCLYGGLTTLWWARNPFIFTVRGNRKVKFIPHFRDEVIFEENGRQVIIYTEMLVGKINRAIDVDSIKKWEPPHENESLTDAQREDILALLCEQYDYQGTTYSVDMSSWFKYHGPCMRCGQDIDSTITLPFGSIARHTYAIGDTIYWQPNWVLDKGGRPENGNLEGHAGVGCPICKRDFTLLTTVQNDILVSVTPDSTVAPMIPDDSEPIVEDGQVVGHLVTPRKSRQKK